MKTTTRWICMDMNVHSTHSCRYSSFFQLLLHLKVGFYRRAKNPCEQLNLPLVPIINSDEWTNSTTICIFYLKNWFKKCHVALLHWLRRSEILHGHRFNLGGPKSKLVGAHASLTDQSVPAIIADIHHSSTPNHNYIHWVHMQIALHLKRMEWHFWSSRAIMSAIMACRLTE